jgi:hypothetical protein
MTDTRHTLECSMKRENTGRRSPVVAGDDKMVVAGDDRVVVAGDDI